MDDIVRRFTADVVVDPHKQEREEKLKALVEQRNNTLRSSPKRGYKPRPKIKNQEERRKRLLKSQRDQRNQALNRSRGLRDFLVNQDEAQEEEEYMEYTVTKVKKVPHYKNHLMMSEWLLEVPSDLDTNWYVVPCPLGRRTLVVSTRVGTRAYNKRGYLRASFPSALPPCTMLDCIWSPSHKVYFILDVLMWNNKTLTECETEFRSYWIRTKLEETKAELCESSMKNLYPFYALEYKVCTKVALEEVTNDDFFGSIHPKLDGLLFYHKQTHYTSGTTPLVGWLKPFMLPEVFGLKPNDRYITDIPEGYTCHADYIENLPKMTTVKNKQRRNKGMRMETDELSSPDKMENESSAGTSFSEELMS